MTGWHYKILYSHTIYVGMARNYGLEHAKGEFIWFVDGDDWLINPEIVQQIINNFRINPNENLI